MKKITTLLAACLVVGTSFSQNQREWNGGQTEKVWDYTTSNWLNPSSILPIPTNFNAGDNAIFNDKVSEGAEKLTLVQDIKVQDIIFNSSKDITVTRPFKLGEDGLPKDTVVGNNTYNIYTRQKLTGEGALIIDGTGTFTLNLENQLTGGTILRNGRIKIFKDKHFFSGENIFGAKLYFDGSNGIADIGTSAPSGVYPDATAPFEIPAGVTATVEAPRYANFISPIIGEGNLLIKSGGERMHIGGRNKIMQWDEFKGNVRVERLEMAGVSPGWYGVILNSTKTFDAETWEGIDSTFYNRKLEIGPGAGIATESGTRAYIFGEITADDENGKIGSYYGNSTGPTIYLIVGTLGTDVVLPAKVAIHGTSNYNKYGFIKVGGGTYTFTNNYNWICTIGLEVREGKVLISNDPTLRANSFGGVGALTQVKENGAFGGIGRTGGDVVVDGKLEPGLDKVIGTLMIVDSLKVNPDAAALAKKNLTLNAGSETEFHIYNGNVYDKVEVYGNVSFKSDGAGKPKLKLVAPGAYTINDGDQFEVLSAFTCSEEAPEFDIEYPAINGVSWSYDIVRLDENTDNPNPTIPEGAALKFKIVVKASGSAVGIEDNNSVAEAVAVYPNPTYGEVKISGNDVEISSVEIYNLQGQMVKSQATTGNEVILQINEVPAGVYFIKVYTTNGMVVQKLIKK